METVVKLMVLVRFHLQISRKVIEKEVEFGKFRRRHFGSDILDGCLLDVPLRSASASQPHEY